MFSRGRERVNDSRRNRRDENVPAAGMCGTLFHIVRPAPSREKRATTPRPEKSRSCPAPRKLAKPAGRGKVDLNHLKI